MALLNAVLAMLALASGANGASGCECPNQDSIVRRTEAVVVHREPLRVPQDPVGSKYGAACVRIGFQIDREGVPRELRIEHSSRNRVLDVAAREAVRKSRFDASPYPEEEFFALVFEYPGPSP